MCDTSIPDTLFYCDPPYWGTEGYGVGFGLDQYTRMAELARSIKGKMIISVNDIPEMRQAFAGLRMESVDITYTVGGGKKGSKTAELVIRNWWCEFSASWSHFVSGIKAPVDCRHKGATLFPA